MGHEIPTAPPTRRSTPGAGGRGDDDPQPGARNGPDAAILAAADIVTPERGRAGVARRVPRSDGPRPGDACAATGPARARRADPRQPRGGRGQPGDRGGTSLRHPGARGRGRRHGRRRRHAQRGAGGGPGRGSALEAAARRAVAAASLAVTRAGAREGMPTGAELEGRRSRARHDGRGQCASTPMAPTADREDVDRDRAADRRRRRSSATGRGGAPRAAVRPRRRTGRTRRRTPGGHRAPRPAR